MANYQITSADDLSSSGAKTKARQNIAAIKLLKEIEAEQRSATTEEQAILIRYSGWGAAPDIFTAKPAWAELRSELEKLLTKEELDSAKASTINAFYTDTAIAAEIYKGVEQLGFSGGKILDPSLGATGIFEGMMPANMTHNSEITGVELDDLSGRIASQLYPDATIHIRGFQDTLLADDYFDLTISNVPFSEIGVSDPRYKHHPVNTLHDYFFAKGLDKLRPGGLLVYITSTGTMQSAKGTPFRQYLSDRANLVGAMRLPGDAFKKNAGTEVTTDLIILQKLGDGVVPNGIAWTELAETDTLDSEGKPLKTNEYFAQRPELMLGELSDDKLYPGRLALKGDGRDITAAIEKAFATMPSGIYQPQLGLTVDTAQRTLVPPELQSQVKQGGFAIHDGNLVRRRGDYLEPAELTGKPYERVIGLMAVRDAVQSVFEVQLRQGSDTALSAAQQHLEKVYDDFVGRNGFIHQRGNRLVFRGDPDYPLLLALENYEPQEKTATKTDIFFKRTIQTYQTKTHADSTKEGLLFSLNEFGKVEIGYIAKLTSQSRLEVIRDLQAEQLIFKDPVADEWQTSDEYLSGNVKQKLEIAKREAEKDSELAINIEALQAVQPEPLLPGDIDVRLGSIWVPASDVEDFAHSLLSVEEGISIQHSKAANAWYVNTTRNVESLAANLSIYGTGSITATALISQTLNLKTPTLFKDDPNDPDKRIIDQDETAAARLKQEEIKERFKDWIWQDSERTDRLTKVYNEVFNTNRERQYDGNHLELPGKNPNFVLRKHQADAVYRSLFGNTLFAHAVGAGKTAEMICSAMEQKRLGLADKPMFVVPNHLLEQWAGDIKHLYPMANVLAATKQDAEQKNRQELMSRIATGQWDAVVVTHSAFGKLKLSEQSQSTFLIEEHAKVEKAILGVDGISDESRRVTKDLEKKKRRLQEKIDEIANSTEKDDTITFEQLGVDLLVVDESHYFKNLDYITKMRNVAGLSNSKSQRAFDMHMKVRYVMSVRGEGKGIIFATGTPITNSMAELYTLQRYLQPQELKRTGLESFDDWASVFGEMLTTAELSAAGKFQVKSRFASFVNLPELMGSVRQVMDIQTAAMLKLPVPKLLNGKPTVIAVPATDDQLDYMADMVRRVDNMGNVNPTEDNMLKLTGDGKATSVDMRLRIPDAVDDPDSKINRFVDDAYEFWEVHRNEKTHLAFCDLGTPKKVGEFSLYQDIKDKLVARGMPEKEIAFAQSYKTDAKKLQLQKDFNKGKIALLISGAQLETGFNGQRRLARISHLTVPWRPDQIEQRDGRMIRQGNRNETVETVRYVTQGRNGQPGMDGYFWQTLEKKAGFISQVMKGDSSIRRMSDVSEEALDFATAKAIATGNPLIMEMATLDNTIRQLSGQKRAHTNASYQIRRQIEYLPDRIARSRNALENSKIDLLSASQAKQAGMISLAGQSINLSQTEEIGKRIRGMANALKTYQGKEDRVSQEIGSLGNFKIYLSCYTKSNPPAPTMTIVGEKTYSYEKLLGSNQRAYEPIRRLLETDITSAIQNIEQSTTEMERNLSDLSQHAQQPFAKEEELAAAIKRLAEVHKALNAETEAQKGNSTSTEINADGSTSDARLRIAPQSEQESGTTKRIAKFLEVVNLQHEVASPEGLYLTLKHEESGTHLVVDADKGERITLTTKVQVGQLTDVDVKAVFQLDQTGILTLDSIEADQESAIGEIALAARLAHYLSVNKDKFSPLLQPTITAKADQDEPTSAVALQSTDTEPTARSHDQQEPNCEPGVAADSLKSTPSIATPHKVTSRQSSNAEPAVRSHEQQEPKNRAESAEHPTLDSSKEAVLVIKSIYSGKETKIVLPSQEMRQPEPSTRAIHTDAVVQSHEQKATESTVRSHDANVKTQTSHEKPSTRTQLENTDAAVGSDNPAKKADAEPRVTANSTNSRPSDTEVQPPETEKVDTAEFNSTSELNIFKGIHIAVIKNPALKGIEVRFTQKPSQEWTKQLKSQKFRFSKKGDDPRWWKKISTASIPWTKEFANSYETEQAKAIEATPAESKEKADTEQRTDHEVKAEGNQPRLSFTQYLDAKEQHPQSIIIVQNRNGYHEAYQDDAVSVHEALNIMISTVPSGYEKHGTVNISRIFKGQYKQLIAKLQETHSVVTVETEETTVYPHTGAATENAQGIQPALKHQMRAERNAAKLIHNAGLASEIIQGEDFHLKVENGNLTPLSIESHFVGNESRLLYLSHYTSSQGEKALDSEVVFQVSAEGMLTLTETAVQNPVGAGELRQYNGGDRTFAGSFTSHLLRQEYDKAAANHKSLTSRASSQRQSDSVTQPEQVHEGNTSENTKESSLDTPQQETTINKPAQKARSQIPNEHEVADLSTRHLQSEASSQATENPAIHSAETIENKVTTEKTISAASFIQKTIAHHDPALAAALDVPVKAEHRDPQLALDLAQVADLTTVEVKVEQLRQWYQSARAQQKSSDVLMEIAAKGREAREHGTVLLDTHKASSMDQDLKWLAEHPLESKAISIESLREWHRANAIVSEGNYKNQIEQIAAAFSIEGVNSINLQKPDYQRMVSDVRALRSAIANDVSYLWQAMMNQGVPQQDASGQHFTGKHYIIRHSSEDDVLRIKAIDDDNREFSIQNGKVLTNTLTTPDITHISAITESCKQTDLQQEDQPQQ